jgi:hypothetical protein
MYDVFVEKMDFTKPWGHLFQSQIAINCYYYVSVLRIDFSKSFSTACPHVSFLKLLNGRQSDLEFAGICLYEFNFHSYESNAAPA